MKFIQKLIVGLILVSTINNCFAIQSIWQVLRDTRLFPEAATQAKVQQYIKYYEHHQVQFYVILNRSKTYLFYILKQVEKHNLPSELALLPFIESGFNSHATSNVGAVGLWQLMPDTARRFGVTVNDWWFHGRKDLFQSTKAALRYLVYLHHLFNNWFLAIAAYNSGEGTVKKSLIKSLRKNKPITFWQLDLPKQTRDYVPKLLAVINIIHNPEKYGMKLPEIFYGPVIKQAFLRQQHSFKQLSSLAKISIKTLQKLNPGYVRDITPPNGPYYVFMPQEHYFMLKANLTNQVNAPLTLLRRYKVQSHDTLHKVALKTHNSVHNLVKLNALKSHRLYRGQYLVYEIQPNRYSTQIYYVKSGDTLSRIAAKFGVSVKNILRWNKLTTSSVLSIGQKLTIKY